MPVLFSRLCLLRSGHNYYLKPPPMSPLRLTANILIIIFIIAPIYFDICDIRRNMKERIAVSKMKIIGVILYILAATYLCVTMFDK